MPPVLRLIVTAVAALLLAACDWESRADTGLADYRHRVEVQPVVLQSGYAVEREFAGQVESAQNPAVAFELPGRVERLAADDGDAVAEGEELARLDTQLLESEAEELAARGGEIEADLDLARRNLARIERLEADQLASERERDELATRVRLLEASLARNAAARTANRIRQEKSVLQAPFDARIVQRSVDAGAVVSAGQPVFTLVEAGRREIRAGVPSMLADGLAVGQQVTVRAGEDRARGEVIAIGAVVDQATRNRVVRLSVARDWSPGEIAYVMLEEQAPQSGAWLPGSAVTEGLRGTWIVYVAVPVGDGEARLEARSVTILHAEGQRLFVTGALADGDAVVREGLHRVAPGQLVRAEPSPRIADARPNP